MESKWNKYKPPKGTKSNGSKQVSYTAMLTLMSWLNALSTHPSESKSQNYVVVEYDINLKAYERYLTCDTPRPVMLHKVSYVKLSIISIPPAAQSTQMLLL